jgi:hypothetical protein
MFDLEFQWRWLGYHVDVAVVRGNHDNLLAEPHVTKVAQEVGAMLHRVRQEARGETRPVLPQRAPALAGA